MYGMEKPETKVLQEILSKMPGAINFLASGSVDPFEGTTENNPLRWIIYHATTSQLDIINQAYEATFAGKEFSIAPLNQDNALKNSKKCSIMSGVIYKFNLIN